MGCGLFCKNYGVAVLASQGNLLEYDLVKMYYLQAAYTDWGLKYVLYLVGDEGCEVLLDGVEP